MKKALEMIRNATAERGGKNAKSLTCEQTGEAATTVDWAKAIAEMRKIKYPSAYGLLMRALHRDTALYGMNFYYTDPADQEELERQRTEGPRQSRTQSPAPTHPGRQPPQAQPGMFHRRQSPTQPQLTSQPRQPAQSRTK